MVIVFEVDLGILELVFIQRPKNSCATMLFSDNL